MAVEVDAKGQRCPKPVIMAMRALKDPAAGGAVTVFVDETVAVENLKRLAASKGGKAEVAEHDGYWAVAISGVSAEALGPDESAAPADAGAACPVPQGSVTVLVGHDALGHGDPELGHILIKGLIYAMSQADVPPHRMVFFNDGARLTCEGSESLDDIRELDRRGCEVLTCGTCLDFHKLKDKLAVGGVTNLYAISEAMLGPDKVVTL